MTPLDLTGRRFGRLVVTRMLPSVGGKTWAVARCDCGTDWQGRAARLTSGHTRSCGCIHSELHSARYKALGAASRVYPDEAILAALRESESVAAAMRSIGMSEGALRSRLRSLPQEHPIRAAHAALVARGEHEGGAS